ncbi:hypothetical protein AB0I28_32860 [Phytomonospora sp. NPDC050363]|uniref:hypothetical protein n=1 Tax=Phytomonospora sp. NPDC050363 TaxID=3155642 RepID=UPI00340A3D2C
MTIPASRPTGAPALYLEQFTIPDHIRASWHTWEAAAWRRMRWGDTNRLHPPDQRFTIDPPDEMCPRHLRMWTSWRDRTFDYRTGRRWPGHPGTPFVIIHDLADALEDRRIEWDEKTSEQMQLTEQICLSGRSPQCDHPTALDSPPATHNQER